MRILTAFGLFLLIACALAVDSAGFFFHQPYYEWWDTAANSLLIERAKHFSQLYGCYSRWGFNHPGPAFLYVQAFGEWFFYDLLKVAPAPYNGQLLGHLLFVSALLVATLRVFTRWLPDRRLFVPVALGALMFHFIAIGGLPSYDILRGPSALLSTWSAHFLVVPFLCLLTAGASVAAGRGRDLPLLALADGLLVHAHVAQPLFVLPLSGLAYLGLMIQSAREQAGDPTASRWRWITAAWQCHRGPHQLAMAIALVFASPVAVDLFFGAGSNMSAILAHLHGHRGEHKPFGRSLYYFLQFGAYAPYRAGQNEFLGCNPASWHRFVRAHGAAFGLWAGVAAVTLWPLAPAIGGLFSRRGEAPAATLDAQAGAARFLAWGSVFLAVTVGISLFWGTIQDGPMYYYNSWFNFSIYGFAALLAVAIACGVRRTGIPRPTDFRARYGAPTVAYGALALCSWIARDRLEVKDARPGETQTMHDRVAEAIAASFARPGEAATVKALAFTQNAWVVTASVGLQMERAGMPFAVWGGWTPFFDNAHVWNSLPAEVARQARPWHFQISGEPRWSGISTPYTTLRENYAMNTETPPLGLTPENRTVAIDFGSGAPLSGFIVGGWRAPEPWGNWSDTHEAVLGFLTAPLAAAVQVVLDLHPFLVPERSLLSQRVRVRFNGEPLGPYHRLATNSETVTEIIPADAWDRAARAGDGYATLSVELPDAISPLQLVGGANRDARMLGAGFQRVEFRVLP